MLGLVSHLGFEKNISAVHLFVCLYQFLETAFDACCPNPLLHFCKWGNLVPHPHHSSFGTVELRFDCSGPWGSTLITGRLEFVALVVLVLVAGGIGQSFLNSKRLPDIFPALGQGVFT